MARPRFDKTPHQQSMISNTSLAQGTGKWLVLKCVSYQHIYIIHVNVYAYVRMSILQIMKWKLRLHLIIMFSAIYARNDDDFFFSSTFFFNFPTFLFSLSRYTFCSILSFFFISTQTHKNLFIFFFRFILFSIHSFFSSHKYTRVYTTSSYLYTVNVNATTNIDNKDVNAERRGDQLMRSNSERDRNSQPREFNDSQHHRDVCLAKYSCRGEVNKRKEYS